MPEKELMAIKCYSVFPELDLFLLAVENWVKKACITSKMLFKAQMEAYYCITDEEMHPRLREYSPSQIIPPNLNATQRRI